jgi:hypothetical protein
MEVLCLFHSHVEVDFPPFVDDFHLEMEVILNQKAFIFALIHSPCLLVAISSMMYELLRNCFVLDDFVSGFDLFFEICGHIVRSHVLPLILCLFSTCRFLVLEK